MFGGHRSWGASSWVEVDVRTQQVLLRLSLRSWSSSISYRDFQRCPAFSRWKHRVERRPLPSFSSETRYSPRSAKNRCPWLCPFPSCERREIRQEIRFGTRAGRKSKDLREVTARSSRTVQNFRSRRRSIRRGASGWVRGRRPGATSAALRTYTLLHPTPLTHTIERPAPSFPLCSKPSPSRSFSLSLPAVAYHTMSLARESIDARRKERSKALRHHYYGALTGRRDEDERRKNERERRWMPRRVAATAEARARASSSSPARTNVACKYKTALGQGSVIYRLPRVIGCRPIDTYPPGLPAGTWRERAYLSLSLYADLTSPPTPLSFFPFSLCFLCPAPPCFRVFHLATLCRAAAMRGGWCRSVGAEISLANPLGNRATFTENLSRPRLAPCQNHG